MSDYIKSRDDAAGDEPVAKRLRSRSRSRNATAEECRGQHISPWESPSFSMLIEFDCLVEIVVDVMSYLSWEEILQARVCKYLRKVLSLTRVSDDTHGLALVRVDGVAPAPSIAAVDLTPEARDRTIIHPLRSDIILGRTLNRTSRSPNREESSNKIDLGIGSEADGVSRRHTRIKVVSVEGSFTGGQTSRHCPNVKAAVVTNAGFVGVAHYGGDVPFKYVFHRARSAFMLKVGDCLVFDAYNGDKSGEPRDDDVRPKQVFRLVRYDKRDANMNGADASCTPPAPSGESPVPTFGKRARRWIGKILAAGLMGSPITVG